MFMVLLGFAGCVTWIDQEPACNQDIYEWSDDLLAFVLSGDGSGQFEFDPDDTPRTQVKGSYNPTTGDFVYNTGYDPAYFLARSETAGFGTAFHNGDLDLLFTTTVTDMLDAVFGTTYRVQRNGCDMTIASWDSSADIDSALRMTGRYSEDSVWSWTADVSGYTAQGSLRQNLTRTSQYEAVDGSYWSFTTSQADGLSDQEWRGDCDPYSCEGTSARAFDGTVTSAYTAFDGDDVYAEFSGVFAYDGSGTEEGTFFIDGDTIACTYVTDADLDCTYACDNGDDGAC